MGWKTTKIKSGENKVFIQNVNVWRDETFKWRQHVIVKTYSKYAPVHAEQCLV